MEHTLNLILGASLFILGISHLPKSAEKILDRNKRLQRFEVQGLILPYFLGVFFGAIFQSLPIAIVAIMVYMMVTRTKFHSAYSLMLGATLGTCFHLWLDLPSYKVMATVFIFSAQCGYLLLKSPQLKTILNGFSWLGVTFLGWSLFGEGAQELLLNANEYILNIIQSSSSSLKILSLGALMSSVGQSSQAILQALASLIPAFQGDLYNIGLMVLGLNIGVAATPLLVSLWLPIKSKRLALAHLVVKSMGVLFCFLTYQTYLSFIDKSLITPLALSDIHKVFAIHTLFNLFNGVIFLTLGPVVDKIFSSILKDKKEIQLKENTQFTDGLIHLLTNVPHEGLNEAKKQFKVLSFKIKSFEDRVVKSLTEPGIRKTLYTEATEIVLLIRKLEDLLLNIRHHHPELSTQAHKILIDFYRLRKIISRANDINEFIRNYTREELDESVALLNIFLKDWNEYRSEIWLAIFNHDEKQSFKVKSREMSTHFLQFEQSEKEVESYKLTASYRLGLHLLSLAESWESLRKHQNFNIKQIENNKKLAAS